MPQPNLTELLVEAQHLAGRDVEVEQTKDGKFIVLFMSFGDSPPPKAETYEGALEEFIGWMKSRQKSTAPDLDEKELSELKAEDEDDKL